MNRGSWHPTMSWRDIAIVSAINAGIWLLPLAVLFPVVIRANLGMAGIVLSVVASYSTMRLGFLVAQRVATRRAYAARNRLLRREP